jgi:hypothetical protein
MDERIPKITIKRNRHEELKEMTPDGLNPTMRWFQESETEDVLIQVVVINPKVDNSRITGVDIWQASDIGPRFIAIRYGKDFKAERDSLGDLSDIQNSELEEKIRETIAELAQAKRLKLSSASEKASEPRNG